MSDVDVDFRVLFEESPEKMLVLLPDAPRFTIVTATKAYMAMTKLTAEQFGKGVFEVLPESRTDTLRQSLDRVIATKSPDEMAVLKYDVRGPDGTFQHRYWTPKNIPVLSAGNEIRCILNSVEEVTDLVVRTHELTEANRELREANEELDAFSYSLAHDLRAPLRAIDGFSRVLVEDYADKLDERGASYVDRICSRAHRMGTLIDDLLALAGITRTTPARESVDLSALASNILAELRHNHPDRRVTTAVADGLIVNGDRRLLNVALVNLIGNAWKYTAQCDDARIEFGRMPSDAAVYMVRDNGAGFDMAYVNKLFTPFQRLHESGEFQGNGVGLATVHRVIARHGGQVWAEGVVGKGATFFFKIPE